MDLGDIFGVVMHTRFLAFFDTFITKNDKSTFIIILLDSIAGNFI